MNPDISTALAIAGTLGGTTLGAYLSARLQRRNQQDALLHNARLAVHTDMFLHLARSRRRIDRIDNGADEHDPVGYGPPQDLATVDARVRMLCNAKTRRAWHEYLDAVRRLDWYISENVDPSNPVMPDRSALVLLREAADGVDRAVRAEGGLDAND